MMTDNPYKVIATADPRTGKLAEPVTLKADALYGFRENGEIVEIPPGSPDWIAHHAPETEETPGN